jgi:hypothetical protein
MTLPETFEPPRQDDCARCAEFDAQASEAAAVADRSALLDVRVRRDRHREEQFCGRVVS